MDSEHRLGLGLGRLGGAYSYIRVYAVVYPYGTLGSLDAQVDPPRFEAPLQSRLFAVRHNRVAFVIYFQTISTACRAGVPVQCTFHSLFLVSRVKREIFKKDSSRDIALEQSSQCIFIRVNSYVVTSRMHNLWRINFKIGRESGDINIDTDTLKF